jgi:hypothetical protein
MIHVIGMASVGKGPARRTARSLSVIEGPDHYLGRFAVREAVEPDIVLELPSTVARARSRRHVGVMAGDGFPAAELGGDGIPGLLNIR